MRMGVFRTGIINRFPNAEDVLSNATQTDTTASLTSKRPRRPLAGHRLAGAVAGRDAPGDQAPPAADTPAERLAALVIRSPRCQHLPPRDRIRDQWRPRQGSAAGLTTGSDQERGDRAADAWRLSVTRAEHDALAAMLAT
jgi:hypothetical protein